MPGLARRPLPIAALLVAAATGCARLRPDTTPVLRVGTSGDYAPFSVERDGSLDGFDVEVARRFARDAGFRLELVRFRWSELGRDLAAGRFDVAMGGVTIRPERAIDATFTRPVVEAGAVVLARTGVARDVRELDRPAIRLGVNAGGHLERVARRLFPRATVVPTADNRALPGLLASAAVDAIVTDDVEAERFAAELPPADRFGPLTHDRKAYLGRDPALVARLDAWLRAHEADGTLATLRAHWLGATRAGRRSAFESDVDALLALVDLRLAFMPAVAAAKARAHRPVLDAEQEARVLATVRERAMTRGLAPEPAVAFFQAQMDAARAVQETFLAHPWDVEPLDLDREARPALAGISELILARAADVTAEPAAIAALDPRALAARLDPTLADEARRSAIANALVQLRRAGAPSALHGAPERLVGVPARVPDPLGDVRRTRGSDTPALARDGGPRGGDREGASGLGQESVRLRRAGTMRGARHEATPAREAAANAAR